MRSNRDNYPGDWKRDKIDKLEFLRLFIPNSKGKAQIFEI